MSNDPQDGAEALDEDTVDDVDDRSGDEYGEGLPDYPPDRPMGVNTVGVTPLEEDAGESFAERLEREEPDTVVDELDRAEGALLASAADEPGVDVGQLVDSYATTEDREEQQIADELPATELSAEEAAMHLEDEPG